MSAFDRNISQVDRLPRSMCDGAKGVIRSFFIKKGSAATRTQLILFGSCADKGPFFCFLLPTCFFNVQTWIEWFVFVVEFFKLLCFFNRFSSFCQQHLFGYLTFSTAIPFTTYVCLWNCIGGFFFTKQKIKNLLKGFEKWFSLEHKQETKVLQGFNSHWQPSQTAGLGKGCDFNATQTLLLHDWVKVKWLRTGSALVGRWRCCAADPSLLYDVVFPPHPELGRSLKSQRPRQHLVMSLTHALPVGWQTQWCHRRSPVSHWVTASRALWALLVTSSAGPGQPVCTCVTNSH